MLFSLSYRARWRRTGLGLLTALCALAAPAGAAEAAARGAARQLGKHEHGAGTLNVVLEGPTLLLELDGPADNYLGFEHAPRDASQRLVLEQAAARLRDAAALFRLPSAAGCRLVSADPALPDWPPAATENQEQAGHDPDGHVDMGATYAYHCQRPDRLDLIQVQVFAVFPGTRTLAASVVGPAGQSAATLTPAQPQLALRP